MIECQKILFDIPEDITYLNAAYMGPLPIKSADVGKKAVEQKLNPWTITAPDFFSLPSKIYDLSSRLIDASPDDMAIIPSVSYGIAIAAKNIVVQKGQKILVLADQFPSNVYSWRTLAEKTGAVIETVDWPDDGNWTKSFIDKIDENTAVVACENAHWTNGTLLDLVAVGKRVREVGAKLVLDLTQTLGVMPFSVKQVDPDYMICATYKWLLGPYSFGFMYVAPRNHDGNPIEESYLIRKDAENFARLVDYKDEYEPGARRFDMGEKANFGSAPIAASSLELFLELGLENITEYVKSLTDYVATRANALGLSVVAEEFRAPNLIGIDFVDGVPVHISQALIDNKIFVSIRGDSIRVAPHIYNDRSDIDKLFSVLERAL